VESLHLAKARAAVDKIRGDVALGIDVVAEWKALRKRDLDRKTLDQAFADFIAGDRHKPKTLRDYRSLWKLYVAGSLGRKPVEDVTAKIARKIMQARRRRRGGSHERKGQRPCHTCTLKVLIPRAKSWFRRCRPR
jgi:hypothetical protein